jgi:hypothetical protein
MEQRPNGQHPENRRLFVPLLLRSIEAPNLFF